MLVSCPECGEYVPEGYPYRENLHALHLLGGAIPGGPGAEAHFLAVASTTSSIPMA